MKGPQAVNIIAAFFVGLVIIGICSYLVGPVNKEKWFKKRSPDSFLNRRGFLGESLHFGYPRTWQGFVVALLMYGVILAVGYVIVFWL